jgi:DNA-binding MarR family transcriptional regulator
MSTEFKILQILSESKEIRLTDLVEMTGSSRQMVHRAVKNLLEKNRIQKVGSAPKTFYRLIQSRPEQSHKLSAADQEFLLEHFFLVTETGSRLTGVSALIHWCNRQNLPIEKTASEFIATRKKYLAYFQSNGLIDGNEKIRSTKGFERIGLDAIYYLDFYAIERFGKTRLGTLLHLAKQGQNKKLMDEIIELSQARINRLIIEQSVDAVGFIPPTIKREVQFMKVLERKLNLPLPHIGLVKVRGEIVIPQKALSKIEDRISNARFSIMVTEKRKFKKILLLDDAIGSGATMNETALKLKENKLTTTVVGLAITGSFKGFDVIQEV